MRSVCAAAELKEAAVAAAISVEFEHHAEIVAAARVSRPIKHAVTQHQPAIRTCSIADARIEVMQCCVASSEPVHHKDRATALSAPRGGCAIKQITSLDEWCGRIDRKSTR